LDLGATYQEGKGHVREEKKKRLREARDRKKKCVLSRKKATFCGKKIIQKVVTWIMVERPKKSATGQNREPQRAKQERGGGRERKKSTHGPKTGNERPNPRLDCEKRKDADLSKREGKKNACATGDVK